MGSASNGKLLAPGVPAHLIQEREESWQEDRKLMMRVAARDRAAGREVALRLLPRARVVALSLLRDPHDAEDAAQSMMVEVLRAAGSFRGECSLETWANRIGVRVALKLARRRRLTSLLTLRLSESRSESDAYQTPAFDALPRQVRKHLFEMPATQREALVLKYVLECTVEEIAELSGVSVNTVKYRLKRALSQLRALARRDLKFGRGGPQS